MIKWIFEKHFRNYLDVIDEKRDECIEEIDKRKKWCINDLDRYRDDKLRTARTEMYKIEEEIGEYKEVRQQGYYHYTQAVKIEAMNRIECVLDDLLKQKFSEAETILELIKAINVHQINITPSIKDSE